MKLPKNCSFLWNKSRLVNFYFLFCKEIRKMVTVCSAEKQKWTLPPFYFFNLLCSAEKWLGNSAREKGRSHKKLEWAQPTSTTGENICSQVSGGGICMSPSNNSQESAIYHEGDCSPQLPERWKVAHHFHTLFSTVATLKRSSWSATLHTKLPKVILGRGIHFHRDTCISTELNFWGTDF